MTNKVTQALGDGAKKLAQGLGQDFKKAGKRLYSDTSEKLHKVGDNHRRNDDDVHDLFDGMHKRRKVDNEGTPIYHLDDEGNISRLRHNPDASASEGRYAKEKLSDEDIELLGLKPESRGRPQEGERHALLKNKAEGATKPREKVSSTRIDPGSSDLARATQLAHHADNYYGKGGAGRNYAAAHVKGANGKSDFILVGRSHPGDGDEGIVGAHSERMLGTPFLRQGEGERIRSLYTEREPCSTSKNCSAWMGERLPHVQVTHSFEYGSTKESRAAGNAEVVNYLKELKGRR